MTNEKNLEDAFLNYGMLERQKIRLESENKMLRKENKDLQAVNDKINERLFEFYKTLFNFRSLIYGVLKNNSIYIYAYDFLEKGNSEDLLITFIEEEKNKASYDFWVKNITIIDERNKVEEENEKLKQAVNNRGFSYDSWENDYKTKYNELLSLFKGKLKVVKDQKTNEEIRRFDLYFLNNYIAFYVDSYSDDRSKIDYWLNLGIEIDDRTKDVKK